MDSKDLQDIDKKVKEKMDEDLEKYKIDKIVKLEQRKNGLKRKIECLDKQIKEIKEATKIIINDGRDTDGY